MTLARGGCKLPKRKRAKPAFISRLCIFGLAPFNDHEQVEPQLLQADGAHEDGLGS